MKSFWILFLFFVNIVLAAVILYINQQSDAQVQLSGLGLTTEELAQVDRIVLTGSSEEAPRILEKHSGQWEIVSPITWPANYFAVKHILNQLAFLREEVVFDASELSRSGQTLADYGLDKPIVTLSLSCGSNSWDFKMGLPTAVGNRVYVMTNQSKIVVVDRSVLDGLLIDLEELRSPEVFALRAFEINELSVQISQPSPVKLRLVQTEGNWIFEAPIVTRADSRAVDAVIAGLLALHVGQFIPTEGKKSIDFGLDYPSTKITLAGQERRQTLLIGQATGEAPGEYYGAIDGNPMVFTMLCPQAAEVLSWQELLRDARILNIASAAVTGIDISQSNATSVRLQRLENAQWQVYRAQNGSELVQYKADEPRVNALISDLCGLTALHFVSDAPGQADLEKWGLDSPSRVVQLQTSSGTVELFFGAALASQGLIYVKTSASPSVYQVPLAWLARLPVNPQHYRCRELENFPTGSSVSSIEIKSLKDDRTALSWSDSGGLLESPAGIDALRRIILSWSVESFVDEPFSLAGAPIDPKTKIPWAYRLDAKVIVSGSAQPRLFQVYLTGVIDGALQLGGAVAQDANFVLTQKFTQLWESLALTPPI